jgi:hypothetical protein
VFNEKQIGKFVFVNYSNQSGLEPSHGKIIALDIDNVYAPFPFLFIIHEMRVCGFNPFDTAASTIPQDLLWQDWIPLRGVFADDPGPFNAGAGGVINGLISPGGGSRCRSWIIEIFLVTRGIIRIILYALFLLVLPEEGRF